MIGKCFIMLLFFICVFLFICCDRWGGGGHTILWRCIFHIGVCNGQKYTSPNFLKGMDASIPRYNVIFTTEGMDNMVLFTTLLLTFLYKCDIIQNMSKKTPSKKGKSFGLRKQGEQGVTANQWTNSPKQNLFLKYYLDPEESETWGNSYQAAIKAGYKPSYASAIMTVAPQWIQAAQNIVKLQPEHLKQALASIANSKYEKASDRIQAIKLLGIDQGMFVQKQLVGHVNIEQALQDLK